MDYKRIEFLLDKFWQCETTLEEEEELRHCFTCGEELPEYLQQFRELFVLQFRERQVCLTEDFNRKILSEIRKRKVRHPVRKQIIFRVAGVVILLMMAGSVFLWQQKKYLPSEPQTPEQALAEVQRALSFVSLKLNRGQQIVEQNMEELEVVTQFIKE